MKHGKIAEEVEEERVNMGEYFKSFCNNHKAYILYKKRGMYNTAEMENKRFNDKIERQLDKLYRYNLE